MIRYFSVFFLLGVVWLASAQPTVTLEAPQPRAALPGEFVTLVFRLSSSSAQTLDLEATSAQNWSILRQPGEVALEPGKVRPIAVTVGVPAGAAAFTEDSINLRLKAAQETLSASVEITVAELRGLALEVPEEIVLGDDGFSVTVINRGNVAEMVTVSLISGGQGISSAEFELAPQARSEATLNAAEAGFFSLRLSRGEEEISTRSVRLISYGIPESDAFVLEGTAQLALDTRTGWQGSLELGGALSDYTTLETRLDARTWRSSFVELDAESWRARVGSGSNDPFRLSLPADFGVSGEYSYDAWGAAGAFGVSVDRALVGFIAGAYQQREGEVAAGFGLRRGSWLTRSRGSWTFEDVPSGALTLETVVLEGDVGYSEAGLNASVKTAIQEEAARLGFGLSASQLLTDSARLNLNGSLSTQGGGTVRVGGAVPLAPEAEADFTFGVGAPMPSNLPGNLSLNTQFGLRNSFANLRYQNEFAWGWRTRSRAGMVVDDDGAALDLASNWSRVGATYLSLDAELTWYPGLSVAGGLTYRYQSPVFYDAVSVFSSGSWDFGGRSLGMGLGALWQDERWQVDFSTGLNYRYALAEPWSATLDLSATYLFDLTVPEAVTERTGGRRLGIISGTVRAGDTPLPDVEVQVGRFRLLTDELGQYRAEVVPGSYNVRVELSSLPIIYRLVTAERVKLEVGAREEISQDFLALKTAALEGRVLQDSDADGSPDAPPRGLSATLGIIDAEGLQRAIVTDEDGFFRVKGLLPGQVEVRLLSGPLGSVPVGKTVQTVEVTAGEAGALELLLQPASARAQSFGGASLRVRRITLEAERVPAGTAPLINVEVQGDADAVRLVSSLGEIDLAPRGDVWTGRFAISETAPGGPLPFEVIASQGDAEKSRRGQIIISDDAPAFTLDVAGPVKAGDTLALSVTTLFAAQSVSVRHPFGDTLNLSADSSRGTWTGELAIPETTPDNVYDLTFTILKEDGARLEHTERVRVTEP